MRLAIIHDWLTGMRGGEKCLEVLCALAPDADLFTLVHVPGSVSPTIERRRITTSFVQHLPSVDRYYRHYLPLFPFAIEQFDLDGYDLVVSFSHCVAKSVIRPGRARHLCYCFTPMRYAWDQFDAYFGPGRVGRLPSAMLRPVMARLARWDRDTSMRVDRYLAISQHVARRIARYYNRPSTIVYPPVDTTFYHPDGTLPGSHALIVSALVPYKRIDLAIEACRLAGMPLRIVGGGPERARLEAQAGAHVTFLGRLPDEAVRDEYRRAGMVLLPGEEDFGIVPVEAQACGRPVVALGRGGAMETVVDGETGILVEDDTPAAFADGLRRAERTAFDVARIQAHAAAFARERHAEALTTAMRETLADPTGDAW